MYSESDTGFDLQTLSCWCVFTAPGNGFPLGALVTTPRVAAAFCTGMEYFNTYGGCNAAVAAGSAVLQQIEALQLQQAAAVVGR